MTVFNSYLPKADIKVVQNYFAVKNLKKGIIKGKGRFPLKMGFLLKEEKSNSPRRFAAQIYRGDAIGKNHRFFPWGTNVKA